MPVGHMKIKEGNRNLGKLEIAVTKTQRTSNAGVVKKRQRQLRVYDDLKSV